MFDWLTVELCLNVFILSFSVFQSATEAIQGQDTWYPFCPVAGLGVFCNIADILMWKTTTTKPESWQTPLWFWAVSVTVRSATYKWSSWKTSSLLTLSYFFNTVLYDVCLIGPKQEREKNLMENHIVFLGAGNDNDNLINCLVSNIAGFSREFGQYFFHCLSIFSLRCTGMPSAPILLIL